MARPFHVMRTMLRLFEEMDEFDNAPTINVIGLVAVIGLYKLGQAGL